MSHLGFFGILVGLVFPPRCAACGEVIANKAPQPVLCHTCSLTLALLTEPPPHGCELEGLFSAFVYSGAGAALMKAFKFNRQTICYQNALQKPFEACVKSACTGIPIDIVVPVPMYAASKRERGFNQSDYIAKGLATSLCLPYDENILQKVHKNKVQHHLPRAERLTNVKGVYACRKPQKVLGKVVLLVDDITTTGATIAECAEVLRLAGAKMVYGTAVLATPERVIK